jgi:hypothetical protein
MSSPVGSDYPGNLVMSVFACFFLILSARSALSAYRLWCRNRRPQTRKIEYIQRYGKRTPQSWETNIGFAVCAFLASVFAFYAIWVHR